MAYLRSTFLNPRPGAEAEVRRLIEELDASLCNAHGLVFSLVLSQANGRIGRISLWLSRDGANREAASQHVLALRSQLRLLSTEAEETLLEIDSGYVPEGFTFLLSAAKQPVYFPSDARQPALPA
jgi:hypothetical protein